MIGASAVIHAILKKIHDHVLCLYLELQPGLYTLCRRSRVERQPPKVNPLFLMIRISQDWAVYICMLALHLMVFC